MNAFDEAPAKDIGAALTERASAVHSLYMQAKNNRDLTAAKLYYDKWARIDNARLRYQRALDSAITELYS